MHSFWLIFISIFLYVAGALLLAAGIFMAIGNGLGAVLHWGGLGLLALFAGFLLDTANKIIERLERIEAELKKQRD